MLLDVMNPISLVGSFLGQYWWLLVLTAALIAAVIVLLKKINKKGK